MATFDFPLTGGVDQSTNAKLLQAPRLVRADNSRFVERGMLRKRRGTTTLAAGAVDAGSPTPVGPVRLANHAGQVLVCSEESLWTVGNDGGRLEELDGLPATTLEGVSKLGHYGAANVVASSCAKTSAFAVYTWATYDGTTYVLHIQVVDLARGSGTAGTVVPLSSSSQGLKCLKAIAIGSKVTVFWGESTNQIRYVDITSATQGPYTSTTGTSLYTDAVQTSPQWFDVSPHGSGYCLVYRSAVGSYKVKRINSSHVEQTTGTFTPGTLGSAPRFAIAGDSADICVAVADNDDAASGANNRIYLYWYSDAIAQTTSGTFTANTLRTTSSQIRSIALNRYHGSTAGDVSFVYDWRVTGGTLRRSYHTRVFSVQKAQPSNPDASSDFAGVTAASKPWMYRGDVYFLVAYWTSQANSFLAVVRHTPFGTARSWAAASLEARFRDGLAPETPPDDSAACVAFTTSAPGDAYVPVIALDRYSAPGVLSDPTGQEAVGSTDTDEDGNEQAAVGNQALSLLGVDLFHFQHGNRSRWQAVTVGQYTCFSGGVLTAFDGRRALEIGWSSYPDLLSSDVTTATTGSMVNGVYQYGVLWEQIDYLGNRSQSALQIVGDKELTGGNDAFVFDTDAIPKLRLTGRYWKLGGGDDRLPYMAIYRSKEDYLILNRLEGTGVTLFPESDPTSVNAYLSSYTDTFNSDTIALVSRERVYTSSYGNSELQNMMPPPSNILCGHENRLFFVIAETPNVVGYTKQQFPGAALAWNATLVIVFDVEIVAMVSQDGNLICFARDRIYTVTGRPADNTGASTGYDPPQLLSGHIGCVSRRSVKETPVGVFFESSRGLEVLPRGGGDAVYIGEMVRETLEDYPIITSVLHVPAASEILVAVVTAETTGASGRVLAYDYDAKVWFVRNYQGRPIVDMTLDGDDVVFGIYNSAAGLTLWKEDGGFDDADGSFIERVTRLGDIRLAGTGGGQRINTVTLLGEVASRCKIQIAESVDSAQSWRSGNIVDLEPTTLLQFAYDTFQPKAQAHALEITELQSDSADSEGLALAALRIDGQNFGQAAKLAGWKRV